MTREFFVPLDAYLLIERDESADADAFELRLLDANETLTHCMGRFEWTFLGVCPVYWGDD